MSNLAKVALGAATMFANIAVSPAVLGDSDNSWVDRSIAAAARAAPDNEDVKSVTRRRSVTGLSGLARIEEEGPRPKAASCIPAQLQSVLNDVEAKYGAVKVTSTCRSASANRAAGGAPQSLHLIGQAVDFRVAGSTGAVMAFLSAHAGVGGLKHYGGGLFHIDTGSRRAF